ncbi:MAG: FkbM family methyltransferase [Candidatus Dependentiae bacterium]
MLQLKTHNLFNQLKEIIPDNITIVEGGAFRGHETIAMAKAWPNSTIYTFEPVPELYKILQDNTARFSNIHCFNLALSNQNGTAQFWPSEHPKKVGVHSQAGSLLAPKERLKWSNIKFKDPFEVGTITLNKWAKQQNINNIDFLWLDLQGYELPVMQAAPEILQQVKYLYTEVHFVEAYADQKQHTEVIDWIEQQDFTMIGKDYLNTSSWFFGNVLFERNQS